MDIVVFGAGSLGSLVGGMLARKHAVTLVGRDPHIDTIRKSGLQLTGEIDDHVDPEATTDPGVTIESEATTDPGVTIESEATTDPGVTIESGDATDRTGLVADLVVVTVKSFDTECVAETLSGGEFRAALSLQNGLGNEATLATHLDCPVLAGTATYGAVLCKPGVVECTGIGEITLGARGGGRSELAGETSTAFGAAGLETTVAEDMPRRLWRKLAVNAGINGVTALARIENSAVLDGDAGDVARAAAVETARVARGEGVDLSREESVAALEGVAEATAANTSSTLQDIESGRRTEVDALNGAVVERGERHGIETPVNRSISSLIRAWERGAGVRN